MNKYKPMAREDIEHIQSMLTTLWMVDPVAFREIHDYMGSVLLASPDRNPHTS